MPIIKPVTELRNYSGISKLIHEQDQCVFLTKNGEGDSVIMSMEQYDDIKGKMRLLSMYESMGLDVIKKLQEADEEIASGKPGIPAEKVMAKLNARIEKIKNKATSDLKPSEVQNALHG